MSSAEFSAWLAAWLHEPWGEDRRDLQLAKICQTVDASQRVKGTVPALRHWFVYDKAPAVKRMKEEDMKKVIRGVAARWNK